ncbi:hypothetical protein, partial [Proteus mirabilis]
YNMAARAIAKQRPDVAYVDIVPLLIEGGRPGPFYNEDGLHLNGEGYRRWTAALRRALDESLPRNVLQRCNPEALHYRS